MSIEIKMDEAKNLLLSGKLEESKDIFQDIIKNQPFHYKAHTNIGAINFQLGKLDSAELSFKSAIKYNPKFEIAFFNLGITQKKLGKLNDAEISFKEAINLKQDYIDAITNLGMLLIEKNKLNDAEECFIKITNYKPEFAEAYYNLGIIYGKLSRFDLAEVNYKKTLELKPEFVDADYNLRKIYRQNKFLSSIEQYKKENNKSDIHPGLNVNPYISIREVESNLIEELYKVNTMDLDKTSDVRYGNGKCSNYELFDNKSLILDKVEKDLIEIMSAAVKSEIFIIESFFNILRAGSGLKSHNHINDFDTKHNFINKKYSLTYYLSVGDQKCAEPGILKLYDPDHEILPSPGTIVIFPADRLHSSTYGGTKDRVMIGVNFYTLA